MRTINIADASELFYEKSNGARMIIKDQKHSVAVSVRVIVGTLHLKSSYHTQFLTIFMEAKPMQKK